MDAPRANPPSRSAVAPASAAQERLNQDLGLGGRLADRSRSRLLNHDGSFNVRRNDLGPFHPYNAYHTLLSLSVGRLLALVAVVYFGTNLLFAALYWLAGAGALDGAAASPLSRFEDGFFFSVQTLATIGYGKLVPHTRVANGLVAVEALVGLLGFAILSGLLFARFTRPTAKIQFSDNILIAPYAGGWALMFRMVNLRNHDLTDVHAVVSFARWADEAGTRRRRFDQLPLERSFIIFMPLHWVVVHPITPNSPLRGLTQEQLAGSDPEVVCLITAHDETFAQTVHAKTSYDKADIRWGARFRDMYLADADHVAIDVRRLHDVEPVEPPAVV
ncbi:MAG TPA: ion channel [Vicinamibacterales bacterium]|nr:ion channel [Vicinamibacterales bacterium]